MCQTFPPKMKGCLWVQTSLWTFQTFHFQAFWWRYFSFVKQCLKWIVLASTWYWIRWYFVLTFFVWSWNLGILANLITKVFSTRRGVEFTYFSYKYSSIVPSHTIFFVKLCFYHILPLSWNVLELDVCNLQETITDPRITRYPKFDTPFSLSPSKSKSKYSLRLKSSTLEYLSSKSWVPFKYFIILFAVEDYPFTRFLHEPGKDPNKKWNI